VERTFDWKSRHDPESLHFPIRTILPETVKRKKKIWRPGAVLNQGQEGACVGFGWSAELAASPVRIAGITDAWARGFYHEAQRNDDIPGENYEGTSVLAGAITATRRKYLEQYRWSFSIDDIIDTLVVHGPIVIGIDWKDGMYETRPSGLVEITGSVVGGHCLLLRGYHPGMRIAGEGWFTRHEVIVWRNSWGPTYGKGGDGYVKPADLEQLLKTNGEACVPVHRLGGGVATGY
jgi:hypothetical protein